MPDLKPIGKRSDLADGRGLRFEIGSARGKVSAPGGADALPAFAVEFDGQVFAYRNRCPHLGIELDWAPGEFFDAERRLLVCSTHGARFDPQTGRCVSGPCAGQGLSQVDLFERNGRLYINTTSG